MIIDSHTHFGNTPRFHCPLPELVSMMQSAGIDKAVISYLGGAEMDFPDVPNPAYSRISQLGVLKRTVDAVSRYPGILYGQMWIMPSRGGYSRELEEMISENRKAIIGLKIHPYHSGLPVDNDAYTPYFHMAERLGLPAAIHTAADKYSLPVFMYDRAKEFPGVKFIMVHMGLGTDNKEAIELIGKLPNLYGDTTWVGTEKVLDAVERIGSKKILFGTDAPISGSDNYEKYDSLLRRLTEVLPHPDLENILWRNAMSVFNIAL